MTATLDTSNTPTTQPRWARIADLLPFSAGPWVVGQLAGEGLKAKAIRGSAWTMAGFGTQQVLRLGSNLVLTRLLFPEVFGLMALVQMVLQGLQMFSDTGLNASVIQHKDGDRDHFINTAWTLQVVRGGFLWLLTCLLAWPVAAFYDQPELMWLIPVVGLNTIVLGFQSTAVLRLQKHVNIKPLVIRELISRVVSVALMIGWALIWPTVWALVAGTVAGALSQMMLSYWLLPGPRPHFRWDRAAVREMYRFGRWIFVSTAVTFLLQQGDKAVLGKLISASDLGVYAIAAMLSRIVIQVVLRVNSQVLFPAYSRVANENPQRLRLSIHRTRRILLMAVLPGVCLLAIFGDTVVGLLYDSRYQDAGWIFQLLAVGSVGSVISASIGNATLAVGDSRRYMITQVGRATILVAALAVGASLAGLPGVVIAVAASKFLDYPLLAWSVHHHGLWLPRLDALAFAAAASAIGAGWIFVGWPL